MRNEEWWESPSKKWKKGEGSVSERGGAKELIGKSRDVEEVREGKTWERSLVPVRLPLR